jgi:aryl-alcohol dehydrogenase-like predicted oxidoreductase
MEYGTVWKVEVEYEPLHKKYGLGLTTWSPLTSAVLSGKCSKGNFPEGNHFALENYKVESCKPVTYG